MTGKKFLLQGILIIANVSVIFASCVHDVTLEDIKSTSAIINWKHSCSSGVSFKVYYEHTKYLACHDQRKDSLDVGTRETSSPSVKLEGLKPYSRYAIEIKPVWTGAGAEESSKMVLMTHEGVPDVTPMRSEISSIVFISALRFSWEEPKKEDCMKFNSKIDRYHYELWGNEPWESGKVKEANIKLRTVYIPELKPFTTYIMQVFAANSKGDYNNERFLNLTAKTNTTKPRTPTSLVASVIPGSTSISLSWRPPYPPTGKIEKYALRYKKSSSEYWQNRITIQVTDSRREKCALLNDRSFPDSVCHVLNNFDPGTSYTFQVLAYNLNYKLPSEWSESQNVTTYSLQTTTVKVSTIQSETKIIKDETKSPDEEGGNQTLIIALFLVGAVLILVVIIVVLVYKLKIDKIKRRHEEQCKGSCSHRTSLNSQMMNGAGIYDGMIPGSSVGTQHTNVDQYLDDVHRHIRDIQSRPLPPPGAGTLGRNNSQKTYSEIGEEAGPGHPRDDGDRLTVDEEQYLRPSPGGDGEYKTLGKVYDDVGDKTVMPSKPPPKILAASYTPHKIPSPQVGRYLIMNGTKNSPNLSSSVEYVSPNPTIPLVDVPQVQL